MDAEGVNLGKECPLTLLQIGTVDNKVYLFDIRLKPELFKKGHVEDLLQSGNTVKVIKFCNMSIYLLNLLRHTRDLVYFT